MMGSGILVGALIIGGIMFFIVLFIFIYLMIKRIQADRMNNKINAYIEQNEVYWYDYLVQNIPFQLPPASKVSFMAIDKIFVSYMTTVNNTDIQQRVTNYASLNMQNYYKKQIISKDEAIRLNVLQRTLLLDLKFLIPQIEQNLKVARQHSMEEYLLMLRVVAKYNQNLFCAHMYKPRLPLFDYEYKVLISTINEQYIEYFTENFDVLPIRLRLALLDFLSLSTNLNNASLTFYERLLTSEYLEIRIRVLKAISAFGMISNLEEYETFVHSPSWEERLMLAKILRFVMEEKSYAYLHQLMLDSNWQVRKQAARSLVTMPKGQIVLQQIMDRKEDLYAVEMAKEVMKLG